MPQIGLLPSVTHHSSCKKKEAENSLLLSSNLPILSCKKYICCAPSRPAAGAVWIAGSDETLVWTGDCSNLGVLSHVVPLQLYDNVFPLNSEDLGHLDCSSNTATSMQIKIPATIDTGSTYSIRVLTLPQLSSSATFQISKSAPISSSTLVSSSPSPSNLISTGTKTNAGGQNEFSFVAQVIFSGAALVAFLLTF